MADKVKIEIEIQSRQAKAEAKRIADAVDEIEKKGKSASQSLVSLGVQAGQGMATIGAAAAGVAAAGLALARFAAEAEKSSRALSILGSAYAHVEATTNGAVAAGDALRAQQTLVQAGMRVSSEQMGVLARAARDLALETGTETPQALEQLTDALRTNSAEGLGRFNLAAVQGSTAARTLSAAVATLAERQAAAGPPTRTLSEDLDRAGRGMQHLGAMALAAANTGLDAFLTRITGIQSPLRTLMGLIGDVPGDAATRERGQVADAARLAAGESRARVARLARLTNTDISALGDMRGLTPAQLANMESGLRGRTILGQAATAARAEGGVLSLGGGPLLNLLQEGGPLRTIGDVAREQANAARNAAAASGVASTADGIKARSAMDAAGQIKALGTAAAATAHQLAKTTLAIQQEEDAAKVARSVAMQFLGAGGRAPALQTAAAQLGLTSTPESQRELFEEIAGGPTREARDLADRRATRDRGTRRGARLESFGGRLQQGLGFEADAEGRIKQFDGLTEGVGLAKSAVDQLSSSFSGLYDAIGSGKSAGEIFQTFVADMLTGLGKMAFNKGLFYTFEGIASLFSNPVAAPLYFAAGAGLIALGAGLGAAGAAARPSPSSAGAGGSQSAARDSAPRSSGSAGKGGQGGAVTVVVSSLVPSGPGDLQQLRNAGRGVRRTFGDRVEKRVEY